MKNILGGVGFALAAAFLTSSMALASTTCPTAQYDSYYPVANFSCVTNNLTFSNFQFSASSNGAVLPTPASIGVVPQTAAGDEGFRFNPGFLEGPNQSQDATVGFLVTAAPGTLISDLFIGFNGSSTGSGATSFTETYCSAGFLQGTCGQFEITSGTINKDITFAGVSQLYITKDFGASCGAGPCTASVSAVTNMYSNTSSVPEPASLSMMGLGLLGLGLVGRRKRKV